MGAVSFPGAASVLPDRPGLPLPGGLAWADSHRGRRLIYGLLLLEIALVAVFAIVYQPFDLAIYLWGGRAVTGGTRLYTELARGNWFTYPPFAAALFTPLSAVPALAVRLAWELASVTALGWACVSTMRLAGYRPAGTAVLAMVAASLPLEPIYHTLYLGQVNLFLLAAVLTDMERVARGRPAGLGIGLAAAIKLVPGIFILLLLLTRRTAAAMTAAVTFVCCALIGFAVDPGASRLYWTHLFFDTSRVSAAYISNQSPYGAVVRILGGVSHVGGWYFAIPGLLGVVGLALATTLARRADWLAAATVTGITGLLVSPISWTHHWVWVLPALVVLARYGAPGQIAAALAYLIFALAPMWWTPHAGLAGDYGAHGLVTVIANCFLFAGMGVIAYIGHRTWPPGSGLLRRRGRRIRLVSRRLIGPRVRAGMTHGAVLAMARWTPYLESEMLGLRDVVGPGSVCLDVGAAAGLYSFVLSRLVGPSGHVHSVEPLDFAHPNWRRVLGIRGLKNLTQYNLALDAEPRAGNMSVPFGRRVPVTGRSFLTGRSSGLGPNVEFVRHEEIPVAVDTMDALIARTGVTRLDFIKIDVEGGELHVLHGGEGTIKEFRPALLVEIEARHTARYEYAPADLVAWLTERDYAMYTWHDGWRETGEVSLDQRNYLFRPRQQAS